MSRTTVGDPITTGPNYEARRKTCRYRVKFSVLWVISIGILVSQPLAAQTFSDVPANYWAYTHIEIFAASGLTTGCGGGNYCPEDPVTRAQMAVFLERGMHGSGYIPPAAVGNVFLDVSAGDFAAAFIEQLFLDGITGGCGNNNYCPNADVSRAQMAVFLLRAKHGSAYSPPAATGVFGDVDLSYWAVAWIERLAAEGITSGCGGGNYCPEAAVTRAQMAVFLVRTFSLDIPATNAPSLQTTTPNSTGTVSLTWTFDWGGGFASTENGYSLEESNSPTSNFVQIYSTVNGNDRESPKTYTFERTQGGTYTLYYRVRARLSNSSWSEYSNTVSVIMTIDNSAVLRIINNTKYDVIDLTLNGIQQIGYPYAILPGSSADFEFSSGGNVAIGAGVGFYDVFGFKDIWWTYTASTFLTSGQTESITFNNPTLGDILTNFSSSRNWQGQYFCYSCNPIVGYARFNFRRNGSYTLYDNNVFLDSGTATLVSWPTYASVITFKVCPTCEVIQLPHPFGVFSYRNGPPDWPIIEYVAQ